MITLLNSKFIDSSINNFCINTCQDFVYESIDINKNEFSDINNVISVNTQNITNHINETIKDELFKRFAVVNDIPLLSLETIMAIINLGLTPTTDQMMQSMGFTYDDLLTNMKILRDENDRNQ